MRPLEDTSSLEFKDHKDFFEEYFKFRLDFVRGLSTLTFTKERKDFTNLYKLLLALIDWTTNYIFNDDIGKQMESLYKDILRFNPSQPKESQAIVDKFRQILKLINNDHEMAEILPKKQMKELSEEEKYYLEEKQQPLRYAKKAFTDMILKRE